MIGVAPHDVIYKYKGRQRKVEFYHIKVQEVTFRDAPTDYRGLISVTIWDYAQKITHAKVIKTFDDCLSPIDALYRCSAHVIDHMYTNALF